jgi:hypothetical protein
MKAAIRHVRKHAVKTFFMFSLLGRLLACWGRGGNRIEVETNTQGLVQLAQRAFELVGGCSIALNMRPR